VQLCTAAFRLHLFIVCAQLEVYYGSTTLQFYNDMF